MEAKAAKLAALGPEVLAKALINLAERSDKAAELIESLLASSDEKILRLRAKVAALHQLPNFYGWQYASELAQDMAFLLENIKAEVDDPQVGVEFLVAFYETDRSVFESCDDSSGRIGDVYRINARDLFVHYASLFRDKTWLWRQIVRLLDDENYGIRDVLVDCVVDYLPEKAMRDMAVHLWKKAEKATDDFRQRHYLFAIESLARQLKDAELFEKVRRAIQPEFSAATKLDIARVWFEAGDAQAALKWLGQIESDVARLNYEQLVLLLEMHQNLGQMEKATDVAWLMFDTECDAVTLERLLKFIGEDRRDEVVQSATEKIFAAEQFSSSGASFLIETGRIADAERYLLEKAEQIDGNYYYSLLPIAEKMEQAKRWLGATAIYRALLDSILQRAQSKYYHHGVRYLRKLDRLASKIQDWQGLVSHEAYKAAVAEQHARKRSFWGKYGQTK